MSRRCRDTSKICYQKAVRTRPLPRTSVQYWWRFRAWSGIEGVPLGQLHSNSYHLTEHLGVLRMAQNANRNGRERMWLKNNFFAPHTAPRAGVPVPSLYEVDGPLIFRTPCSFDHAIARFIDLNETSRRQDRVHGEILGSNIAVGEVAVGELLEVRDRNESPFFDHAAQVSGATLVEARIHAYRNLHGRETRQSIGNMRFWRGNQAQVGGGIPQIDAIP